MYVLDCNNTATTVIYTFIHTLSLHGALPISKIKQHGFGDGPEADVEYAALKPEQKRQDREEEPGVNAEEGDLEYRIEGDQTGHILIVTPGELVPHQHHRDAPRETDKDDAGHRSEEHTSELQSLMRSSYAVFCLKKKKKNKTQTTNDAHHHKKIKRP